MNKGLIITLSVVLLLVLGIGSAEFAARKTYLANHIELNSTIFTLFKNPKKAKKGIKLGYKLYIPINYNKFSTKKDDFLVPRFFDIYEGNKSGSIVILGGVYPHACFNFVVSKDPKTQKELFSASYIEEDKTLAYKINKLTGRTSYNRALSGTGPAFVYKQLSDKNIKNEIKDPAYFIYVYNHDDLHTQFNFDISPYFPYLNINYKIKDDKLVEDKHSPSLLYTSFLVRNNLENKSIKELDREIDDNFPLFSKLMEESAKEMKAKFPNAKFVIVNVPDKKSGYADLNEETIVNLEKKGIIYLDAEKLLGHKLTTEYRLGIYNTPNERFWDELSLALKRKFDL